MNATYHSVIRSQSGVPLEVTEEELKNKEALEFAKTEKLMLKTQWHEHGITQELLKYFSSEIVALEERARELACAYPTNQNHQEIIQLLVRSSELRKLNKVYGRSSN